MTFSENNILRKRHGFLRTKGYDETISQTMQRGQKCNIMYTNNSVNPYDYVICSNDTYGIIHHIPSRMIVKCSSELAETLRRGIDQEPVDEQTARYLSERFERNTWLDLSCRERSLTGIDIFMSVWPDSEDAYFNADTGRFDVKGDIMSKETADCILAYLVENFDEVENVTFFGEELDQEYRMITYICRRIEEEFSVTPAYRLVGCFRSIPEEFLHDMEKFRIRLCGNLESMKGISGCLGNTSKEALLNHMMANGSFTGRGKIFCEAGLKMLSVDPNGDIYPCHAFAGQEEWLMGNILDCSWENRIKCRKVRAALEGVSSGCICSRCTAREVCPHCMATIALEWNCDYEGACRWKRRCNEYALLDFCKS